MFTCYHHLGIEFTTHSRTTFATEYQTVAQDWERPGMLVKAVTEFETEFALGWLHAYLFPEGEYAAFVIGDVSDGRDVLTRLHDQCMTADVFHSDRCDCRQQRLLALRLIASAARGLFLHTPLEGRGQGLVAKVHQYAAQSSLGLDTIQAGRHLGYGDDSRDYARIPLILRDLEITSIHLLTSNPQKVSKLTHLGVQIAQVLPLAVEGLTPRATRYVAAKRRWHNQVSANDKKMERG